MADGRLMAGLLLCPWRTSRHFQLAQVLLTFQADDVSDANTQYTDTMDSDSDDDIPLAGLKKAAAKPDKAVSSSSAAAAAKKKAKKKRPNYKEDSDHDDEDDDDYDEPSPPKKKKKKSSSSAAAASSSAKKKKAASSKKSSKTPVKKENGSSKKSSKKSTTKKSTSTTPKGPKKLKQLDKSERISHAMQAYLWWNADDPPKGQQWVKMEHAGVSFPEAYEPHGVKMRYDGKEVDLTPLEEEA